MNHTKRMKGIYVSAALLLESSLFWGIVPRHWLISAQSNGSEVWALFI